MSIFVGQLVFNGPYLSHEQVKEEAGFYLILSPEQSDEENLPLEFGVTKLGHANNLKAELLENGITTAGSYNTNEGMVTSFAAVIYSQERPDITVDTVVAILRPAA